jgi:hypothetical protein
MNEQRIQEIASQCSAIAVEIPFFRGIENGLTWEATIQKARDLKFAELIVRACADVGERYADGNYEVPRQILEHFGLEEE